MKPVLYTSYDDGAPVLDFAKGSLNVILKACLITGYGDKEAMGWQMLHEDMDNALLVLSPSAPQSLGTVLQINDNDSHYASVTACLSFDKTNNTGIDPFGKGYFVKKWASNTTNAYWSVIASDTFFYLWIQTEKDKPSMGAMTGFGDLMSLTAPMASVLLASSDTYYSQSNTGHHKAQSSVGELYFPRPVFDTYRGNNYLGDRAGGNVKSANAIFAPMMLYQDNRQDDGTTRREPAFVLPGMLMPFSEILGYKQVNSSRVLDNQAPFKHPVIGHYQPWCGCFWLQMDDWGRF